MKGLDGGPWQPDPEHDALRHLRPPPGLRGGRGDHPVRGGDRLLHRAFRARAAQRRSAGGVGFDQLSRGLRRGGRGADHPADRAPGLGLSLNHI